MNRPAILLSVLVLLLISALPIGRTLAESFMVVERVSAAETTRRGAAAPATPSTDAPAVRRRRWGLENYARLFVPGGGSAEPGDAAGDPEARRKAAEERSRRVWARWRLLGNSVVIALLAAIGALLLGVPYALLTSRTDVALRRVLTFVYPLPLLLPPLLVAVAWTFAFPPDTIVAKGEPTAWDRFLREWGGPVAALRAAGVFALCYFPLVVLFARRAFARVPASLEEAARLAGGSWAALRTVTLPLAAPGILAGGLFVFLFALNDFALVDFLNWVRPTAQQISVYPFESFVRWRDLQGTGLATALGTPLALLGVGLLYAIHRLVGQRGRGTMGSAYRPPARWPLRWWRVPAAIGPLALVGVAVVAPAAGLLHKAGDLGAYRATWAAVAGPNSQHEVLWSLWLALGAAALSLPLAFVLGHHAARTGRAWPLAVALLPLALPPIFLGAGYLRVLTHPAMTFSLPGVVHERNPFLDPDGPRFGPMLLLLAKYVPFAIAAAWAAFLEIDPRLEEAGRVAGVRPLERALGILEPLVRPALALGFVLVGVFALREIDTIVLLSSDSVMRKIYTQVHYQRDEQVAALCVLLLLMEGLLALLVWLLLPRTKLASD